MGLFLIAKSNIKKKKGNAFILFLLIALAVLILYVGISVLSNMDNVIDNRNKAISGADYFLLTASTYTDEIVEILEQQQEDTYLENEKAIYIPVVKFYNDKESVDNADQMEFVFLDKDADRNLSVIRLIDEGEEWKNNSIILSYYMKVGMGYKTGDMLYLQVYGHIYSFEIYGFTEDIMFSTPTNFTVEKCFISSGFFGKYMEEWGGEATIYRADLTDGSDTEKFESYMNQTLSDKILDFPFVTKWSLNYATMKYGTSITANIFMGVLTVFSVLLIFISLIIVHFNVNNSIEMNMKNIGMLEASGYTSGQLKAATVLEFLLIGFVGICVGLLGANGASKAVGGILSASIGLRWDMGFDIISAWISAAITLLLVILTVFLCSGKYKKITPLNALRNGIHTHNFKKNSIRMDKINLPLDLAIGIKSILYNKKKNFAVLLMIVVLTFCANEAVCIYQNFALQEDKLLNITGFEVPDITVTIEDNDILRLPEIMEHIKEKTETIPFVIQVLEFKSYDMVCKNGSYEVSLNCDVYDKTNNLRIDNVVDGRRPEYDNELMLSTVMAEKLNVTIGDVLYLELNGERQDYILVGISQGINRLGKKALITKEGLGRLIQEMTVGTLYIYVEDNENINTVINDIKAVLSNENAAVTNSWDYVSTSMGSTVTVMKVLCMVMMVVVILVIAMILVLLIKTQMVRDQKQLGIYKALGYTTGQLMIQTTMSYIPIVFIGTLIGCIAAWFGINPSFVLFLSAFGIQKCSMNISLLYMSGVVIVITLWAEMIAVLCSARIRKIVPCKMIKEM